MRDLRTAQKKKRAKLSLERGLYITGLILLVCGIPLLYLYMRGVEEGSFPPCLFYQYFGVYCPGCGGSRAVKALFSGDIVTSLFYHPFVLYTAVVFGVFMISQTLEIVSSGRIRGIRFHPWFLYAGLFMIVINCLIKNILKICFGIPSLDFF